GGEPVEARHAGRRATQLLKKARRACREVTRVESGGIARGALDDVGEADAKAQERGIMLGPEDVDREPAAHARAQLRGRERRPEPVRRAREVVALAGRVEPGIDPDEDELEPRP